jgi:N-acetylglucosaminyl-diphospho-decaprenol L-rhamnosyltransferase
MGDIVSDSDGDQRVAVVIVVSYARPEEVVACIDALAKSTLDRFEIVVVENGGAREFDRLNVVLQAKYSSSLSRARLIGPVAELRGSDVRLRSRRYYLRGGQSLLAIDANDNLGYAGGVNIGLRSILPSDGWCGAWILNPDTEPAPNALTVVVEYARQHKCDLVGSRLVLKASNRIQVYGGARWIRLLGRAKNIGFGKPADSPVDVALVERDLDWLSGAATYATVEYVRSVGLMEEKYFLYCEDVDWSFRRGRFRLGYAHESIVIHAHGTTIGSSHTKDKVSDLSVYLGARNTLLLSREHFPHWYPLIVLSTILLLPDSLLRGNWRVFRAAWRGWLAGLRREAGRPADLKESGGQVVRAAGRGAGQSK